MAQTEEKATAESQASSGVPEARPGAKTDTEKTKEEEEAMRAYAEKLNTKNPVFFFFLFVLLLFLFLNLDMLVLLLL